MMERTYVFNGKPLCEGRPSGVHRHGYEVMRELDRMDVDGRMQFVVPAGHGGDFSFEQMEVVEVAAPFPKCPWASWTFPAYVRKVGGVGVDLLCSLPPWGCAIQLVPDCIAELFPQDFTTVAGKRGRRRHISRVRKVVRTTSFVVTGSECAKSDIVRMYGCDASKVRVVPCAWQHVTRVEADKGALKRLGLTPGEYFFLLGHRTYHKNFRWALEAAKQNPEHTFVVTGLRSTSNADAYADDDNPSNLLYTGYLSDEEIVALMAGCKAFVHPALYEGFGIPPLEAMALGARCLVSTGGSLPEVYGDAVTYFDPLAYSHIDMDELLAHEPVGSAEDCLARYSWKRSAEIVYDCMRSC